MTHGSTIHIAVGTLVGLLALAAVGCDGGPSPPAAPAGRSTVINATMNSQDGQRPHLAAPSATPPQPAPTPTPIPEDALMFEALMNDIHSTLVTRIEVLERLNSAFQLLPSPASPSAASTPATLTAPPAPTTAPISGTPIRPHSIYPLTVRGQPRADQQQRSQPRAPLLHAALRPNPPTSTASAAPASQPQDYLYLHAIPLSSRSDSIVKNSSHVTR